MSNTLRSLLAVVLAALIASMTTACFNDTATDITANNDLAITSMALGTLKRTVKTYNSVTKKDSTYESTLSCSTLYPLTIDQLNNRIYNVDSLPYGVDASRTVMSSYVVTTGTTGIRRLDDPSQDTLYTSTDTTDFSVPRVLNLYGEDGISRRSYEVDIRVHKQTTDSVNWDHMPDATANQTIIDNTIVTNMGGNLYLLESYWIFNIIDGVPHDNALDQPFTESVLPAEDAAEFPTDNFVWASHPTRTDSSVYEVLLYGTVGQWPDCEARLWRKCIDITGQREYAWEYLPMTPDNSNPIPTLRNAYMVDFDEGYLFAGINTADTLTMVYSPDRGRVWKTHDDFQLPAELAGSVTTSLVVGADGHKNVWFIRDDHDVWRGRLHRLEWATEQKAFTRSALSAEQ